MDVFEKQQQRIQQIVREIKMVKAYTTRVEAQLEELLGGVGTAQKTQSRKEKKEERMEQLRMDIKARFHNPKTKLFTNTEKARKQFSK